MSAHEMMGELNPNALHGREGDWEIFIEDIKDPDGRWYRVEYRSKDDGSKANAYLLYNPWGDNPFSYGESHVRNSDGLICLGPGVHADDSPYDLNFAVPRTRFWCTGYSYMREHGYPSAKADIDGW